MKTQALKNKVKQLYKEAKLRRQKEDKGLYNNGYRDSDNLQQAARHIEKAINLIEL